MLLLEPVDSISPDASSAWTDFIAKVRAEHGLLQLIQQLALLIAVLLALWILIRVTNWGFRKLSARIERLRETKLRSINIHDYELLDTRKQVQILLFLARVLRYGVILLLLLIAVPIIFSIFPATKNLAYKIFSYIWDPVSSIFVSIVDYIPNLFTICVIYLVIKYTVRFVKYISNELASERLKIPGFYADWAHPTYYIVRFLLYAFMVAMIYPYLPGANSGIFQGMSVFIGLMISLGSSSIIGNIIAGLVITYMRPFKIGDRIKLNNTTGNVIEKTALVTRLRTPKNEIVTIPNSEIMSKETVNFSQSARQFGLIIHTEVTIGYDAPWRTVHDLLINAALNTPGILDDPRPFVLETSLSDWYPVYQLNAYIRDADRMGEIYSNLHQSIQDAFNAAGVEIMSPHYMATRDGNASTIPS